MKSLHTAANEVLDVERKKSSVKNDNITWNLEPELQRNAKKIRNC